MFESFVWINHQLNYYIYNLGTPLRISGVQTSKGVQPQYTVVTVAQPKLMPSNQLNIGPVIDIIFLTYTCNHINFEIFMQQTSTRLTALNDRLKTGVDINQPQTLRVVQSQISGKPMLVTNKVSGF